MSHTVETIRNLLSQNDEAVRRALIAINNRQTHVEQRVGRTIENNGRGWNGRDAELMSSFADQLQRRGWLSFKQMCIARRRLMKYAGQLLIVATEKAAARQ